MSKKKEKKNYFRKIFLLFILIIAGTFLYGRFVETRGLIIKEYKIINNKLPESFNGFKIVHFSDVHYGTTIFKDELTTLVNKINELKPDVIIFTGDLIDYNYQLKEEEKNDVINILSKLDSAIDKYAIKGNHDQNNNYLSIIKNAGFKNLNNTNELLYYKGNTPIRLVGLDDYLEGTINIDEAFKYEIEPDYYTIFLAHEPDIINKLDDKKIDLMLSGHSHNGQVRLPFLGAIYKPIGAKTYYDERYQINDTLLYISSGIGTSKYPIRLFNKPSFNFYRLYTK